MTTTEDTAASCALAPVKTDECNFSFGLPLSMIDHNNPAEGAMPCIRDLTNGIVTSFWRPDDGEELIDAVDRDTGIHVMYFGYSPHTRLGLTRDRVAAAALRGQDPQPYKHRPGCSWTAMGYDGEVRQFLAVHVSAAGRPGVDRLMGWLVLTRKKGESIRIGDDIEVAISKVDKHGHVSLGIKAPKDVRVLRSEIVESTDLGVCPQCETGDVRTTVGTADFGSGDRFYCNRCAAQWRGLRRKVAA